MTEAAVSQLSRSSQTTKASTVCYLLKAAELGESDILKHPELLFIAFCLRRGAGPGGWEAATGTRPIIQMPIIVQLQGVLGHTQHHTLNSEFWN